MSVSVQKGSKETSMMEPEPGRRKFRETLRPTRLKRPVSLPQIPRRLACTTNPDLVPAPGLFPD